MIRKLTECNAGNGGRESKLLLGIFGAKRYHSLYDNRVERDVENREYVWTIGDQRLCSSKHTS